MSDELRVVMVTTNILDDIEEGLDLSAEPTVILQGGMEAVKAAAKLFGEPVTISALPAAAPVGVSAPWPNMDDVRDASDGGRGFWRDCSGCHDLNEGHPTGPFSRVLNCHLGFGCSECGGLGAIWDTTNYAEMGDWLAKQDAPASLPAVTVGVRKLVWEDFGDWGAKASAYYQANYLIQFWKGRGQFEVALSYPGYQTGFDGERWHPTLDAAKAAAQADYTARILAALDVDAVAALVDAVDGYLDGVVSTTKVIAAIARIKGGAA